MARIASDPILALHAEGTERARQPALNLRHVGVLFVMRWKLTVRGYRRGRALAIVGLGLSLLFLLSFIGSLGVITNAGYRNLSAPLKLQLLFVVLAGISLAWIALPLLQYSLNEGLDVTKLQIYPVTRAEQMAGLLLATLLDVGTLGIIGLYVPIVLNWTPSPAAVLITLAALVLAYVHTVGMSQLTLAALMGLLRSRRFRDVTIVVFALFGASCSLLSQVVSPLLSGTSTAALENVHIDRYLQFTPPGMAARGIELAARGDYLPALGWLAALAALAPVLLVVWSHVLERGITAAEAGGGTAGRATRRRQGAYGTIGSSVNGQAHDARTGAVALGPQIAGVAASGGPIRTRRGVLSPAALAVAAKDARYLWRDPQLKASLVSSLFILVLVLLPTFNSRGGTSGLLDPARVLTTPIPTLIVALNLALNSLGLERSGLQMLYLFPIRPLDVFWGKNLTIGAITFGAQIVLATGVAAFTGGWSYVPVALVGGLAAVLVLLGCGNVTSVLLPFRVREMRAGRANISSDNGCLRSMMSLVTLGVAGVLLLPVLAAIILPLQYGIRVLLFGTLPVALLYGVVLHQAATRLIAPRLLNRAPEILAATVGE